MRLTSLLIALVLAIAGLLAWRSPTPGSGVAGLGPLPEVGPVESGRQGDLVLPASPILADARVMLEPGVLADSNTQFDDPLEVGPCALELRLYDVSNGQSVSGGAQLWRIGAPPERALARRGPQAS